MKALIVSNITKRIQAGHYSMITPLKELGYEVHWVANLANFKEEKSKFDFNLHHINFFRNPFDPRNIMAGKQLYSLIKKEKFDIVHCNSPIGGLLGRICSKLAGVKIVMYTAHGFHFYKGAPITNRTLYKFAEIVLAKITDGLITMNKEDFDNGRKITLNKNGMCFYIPGIGIDSNMYNNLKIDKSVKKTQLGLKDDDFAIISMGDLIHRKNYATAIRAIAMLNNPNVHYLICGDGPLLESLKELSIQLNVEDNIHFLGFRTDIAELLNISDLYLLTAYQEGLPRALMEAMSAGIPVIASNIRGNVDLVEEGVNGFMSKPDDVDGFAKGIATLYKDRNLSGQMGRLNLIRVKSYDISSVKMEMIKIYKEIIGS